jgi:hypothetical protein
MIVLSASSILLALNTTIELVKSWRRLALSLEDPAADPPREHRAPLILHVRPRRHREDIVELFE